MPVDSKLYPFNWRAIGRAIRARAGYQCECSGECGLHHDRRCEELDRRPAKWAKGKVVLTIAHLDHDTKNNAEANLKAMCNRCHLRLDSGQHQASAAKTRRRKHVREFPNQPEGGR